MSLLTQKKHGSSVKNEIGNQSIAVKIFNLLASGDRYLNLNAFRKLNGKMACLHFYGRIHCGTQQRAHI
jgi:hypothetical protein